jgi:hypothetical protein
MVQKWEAAYAAAMLETDPQKLADKIEDATLLLRGCLAELGSSSDDLKQRQSIEDALRTLAAVRRIELRPSA